ncbi:hypothetical protein EO244_05795 [Ancylomarina salipaludis]|uniref:Uncharacterized protein n=1 Tax=Ancylomarina salipaludis TaxID=2501299 RepID=A0A4Q1JMK0_9BACT|nr:hypothetical protein [Ancylomarina salipaludis]RXQ95820.1 hypothetical protein EO244_05795 [Ancylomarina salipaludis]
MKGTIWQPVLMTMIVMWRLSTAEKRVELLEGNFILWLIIIAFVVSWFVYFMQKRKKIKRIENDRPMVRD